MRVAQVKVYKFSELSQEAKEKALKKLRDINVDYDWWKPELEQFQIELRDKGIEAEDFSFDLDRGTFLNITKGYVLDERRVLKSAGVDLRTGEAKDAINYGITLHHKHTGGGEGHNYFEPNNLPDVNICEWLKDILMDFWKELRDTYDYFITDEAAIETIEVNEYEFTEDGELF